MTFYKHLAIRYLPLASVVMHSCWICTSGFSIYSNIQKFKNISLLIILKTAKNNTNISLEIEIFYYIMR